MYHCDACGWDGTEPVLTDEPSLRKELFWTLRVCPTCGKEVYDTTVVRVPIDSCGHRLRHPGPCAAMC
jgi:predicted RNA-binding Zn-ribbon protein involved in translation (DUF1610 family)